MSLTNTLIETTHAIERIPPKYSLVPPGVDNVVPIVNLSLNREATLILLKMMAPITPAFAEESWAMITKSLTTPRRNLYGFLSERIFQGKLPGSRREFRPEPGSIFNEPFPEPDGTYELLAPQTMKCAVQVNGKLRCAVDVPIPDAGLSGENLQVFIVKAILKTEEGKALERKVNLKAAKKIVVVRGGKTVNFVV
jgi:leucyl-tRNA synthetase